MSGEQPLRCFVQKALMCKLSKFLWAAGHQKDFPDHANGPFQDPLVSTYKAFLTVKAWTVPPVSRRQTADATVKALGNVLPSYLFLTDR